MFSSRPQRRRQEVDRRRLQLKRWHTEIIHTVDQLSAVQRAVTARMTSAGYPERKLFAMQLALEEAIVNAIKHGHHGDAKKSVRVRYRLDPTRLEAEICDQGPGFDPRRVPDPTAPENLERPSGRGLLLMRHFMTSIRFNKRGNCVTLCLERSG